MLLSTSVTGAAAWPPPMLSKALSGPLAGCEEVIFAQRGVGSDGHWYANFGYHVLDDKRMMFGRPLGGRLCAEPANRQDQDDP